MSSEHATNVDDATAMMKKLSVVVLGPVLSEISGNDQTPSTAPLVSHSDATKSNEDGLEDNGVVEEILNDEKQNEYLDAMFDEQARTKMNKKLPKNMKIRQDLLTTKLMKHQAEGVKWMIMQEINDEQNPFFKKMEYQNGNIRYRNSLTGRNIVEPPAPIKGSILADDMGLGKTIQSLALILSNPPNEKSELDPYVTLVVAPKSAIPNWVEQTNTHVKKGNLSTKVYEGASRAKLIREIHRRAWNIVIVTYETLASDYKKYKDAEKDPDLPQPRTLFSLNFHRIILDEAHNIRNPTTKVFAAAVHVKAANKVALTGTPFVNQPEDIYSLLRFLNVEPLNQLNVFKEEISKKIKEGRTCGLTRLRTVMMHASLRRTKDLLQSDLPGKTMTLKHIPFKDDCHKTFHDAIYMIGQICLQALSASYDPETKKDFNKFLFQMISRVRQACCSGHLFSDAFRADVVELAAHVKCASDESKLSVETATAFLASFSVLSKEEKSKSAEENVAADTNTADQLCPKIKALLHFIETEMKEDEKAVVFSSFTSFMDLIGDSLEKNGVSFTRLDGSMTIEERAEAIASFQSEDSGPRVILCSVKAAGSGINLTRGNICFLVDPWFNRAIEDQAADRVYRLGQERPVQVFRLIMKDSVEERLFFMQKSKQVLGKGAMEKLSKQEEEKLKVLTLKSLMGIDDGCLQDDFDDDDSFIVDDLDISF